MAAIAAGHHPAVLSCASSTKPSKVNRICANRLRQKSTATEAAPRAGASRRRCNSRARTTSPPICAAGSVVLIDSAIQRSGSIVAKDGRSRRGNRHCQAPQSITTVAARAAMIPTATLNHGGRMAHNDQEWAESDFEITSKRRKGFPSETQVKRGVRIVHGNKELSEKLGRNDLCPCGSGRRF